MKKIISIIITAAVLLSAMSVGVFAVNLHLTTTQFTLNGRSLLLSNSKLEEAIDITAEEAGYIAELFVADMIVSGDCSWNEETEIVDIVTLYDETGTSATAYTVNMTEGYVVVSAFADAASLIPEWSDTAEPLCESFSNNNSDRIIYLGCYEYYLYSDAPQVVDLYGNVVEKNELVNLVEESRDISNVTDELLMSCAVNNSDYMLYGNGTSNDGSIYDAHEHANATYGGTFSTQSYANYWGEYIEYNITESFRNVAPIAHIIMAARNRYNINSYDYDTFSDVLGQVIFIGKSFNFMYYTLYDTIKLDKLRLYIWDCCYQILHRGATVSSNYETVTYNNIVYDLNDNCLLFLLLNNHPTYAELNVLCFAYTVLYNNSTGFRKTYLKVVDSIHPNGRYIDLLTVTSKKENLSEDHDYPTQYLSVKF